MTAIAALQILNPLWYGKWRVKNYSRKSAPNPRDIWLHVSHELLKTLKNSQKHLKTIFTPYQLTLFRPAKKSKPDGIPLIWRDDIHFEFVKYCVQTQD